MRSPHNYIDIAVALPVHNTFTYNVPKHLAAMASIGKRVLVPFGRRSITGYILGPEKDTGHKKVKDVLDVLDEHPLFPASMIPFFKWTADYYMHPIGDVITCALPKGLNLYDFVSIRITEKGDNALFDNDATPLEREILKWLQTGACSLKNLGNNVNKHIPHALIQSMQSRGLIFHQRKLKGGTTRQKIERHVKLLDSDTPRENLAGARKKIVATLKEYGEVSVRKLKTVVPSAPRLIKHLAADGYIAIVEKKVYRDPFGEPITADVAHILTKEQKNAISTLMGTVNRKFTTCLLTGVTGSGKTEVYMQLAEKAIDRGLSVLVLVPEIALISQMERRFRARFGECVAILHSGLSAGERYDQWVRITQQKVNIAIGTRSAVFAPFTDIGIIVVDEEHDTSYKQEGRLRYNARDLAIVRAKLFGGIALLGSATPSIQSYHNVTTKKFKQVTLTERVENRPLPKITVVDLRKSRDIRGIQRFITPKLREAIETTLTHDEQALLFLNRRGFASYPVCSACGESQRCKNCDISLTLHRGANAYKCHYCGFTRASASNCAECGSSKIRLL